MEPLNPNFSTPNTRSRTKLESLKKQPPSKMSHSKLQTRTQIRSIPPKTVTGEPELFTVEEDSRILSEWLEKKWKGASSEDIGKLLENKLQSKHTSAGIVQRLELVLKHLNNFQIEFIFDQSFVKCSRFDLSRYIQTIMS